MSWRKVKLGEVCTIEKGAIGIQKAIPGEYPLVVTGEDRKSHNEYQFDCAAVIIPLVSGTGHGHASIKRIHFQTGKFALGNILCAVVPKDETELNAEYLYRFLDLNKENELVARMKGMANVTLPIKELAQVEIPIPSLEQQKEFVNNYKLLEAQSNTLSTELTHQLTLVKKLRQQLLQDAVQGKLVPQDASDEPASALLQKIKAEKAKLIAEKKIKKEKELPAIKPEEIPFEIPQNWVWCRLGEVCTIEKGLIGIQKAIDGKFPLVVTGEKRSSHNEYHFEGNAVIIPLVSSTGHGHASLKRIHYQEGKFALGNILACVMTFIPEKINMFFLFNYLDCYKELFFIEKMKGAANISLKISSIKETPIPLIPIIIQNKYAELMQYCHELEASIKASQVQNEQLLQQVLKEALQQQPIEG